MFEAGDEGVKNTAAELLKELALHRRFLLQRLQVDYKAISNCHPYAR